VDTISIPQTRLADHAALFFARPRNRIEGR